MKKKDAAGAYQIAGLEVLRSQADAVKSLRARGVETAVVVQDPDFAEELWRAVKKARDPDEALRPAMYALAGDLRNSGMHALEQLIEYERTLTTLQLFANSKFSERAVTQVADELVYMTADLLGLDVGELGE